MDKTNEVTEKYVISTDAIITIVKQELISINKKIESEMGMTIKVVGKGIRVETKSDTTSIDIHISVKYGMNIPQAAQIIQGQVYQVVEYMAGLAVSEVNIYVDGVEA